MFEYTNWQNKDLQEFSLEQFFREEDEVEYSLEDAIKGIQKGLDDFEAGRSRSFDDFVEEKFHQYNILADS